MTPSPEHPSQVTQVTCPQCKVPGKKVKTITLKSLLVPGVLKVLNPHLQHYFCRESHCPVVYYGEDTVYLESQIKVPVLQKKSVGNPPACYCFGFSRGEVLAEGEKVVGEVKGHIQAGRCGCEVNNPQGSCCLGNLNALIQGQIEKVKTVPEEKKNHLIPGNSETF
ncbi:putative iron-sulfur cluster-binding metallochaperone [Deinococcus cellulosilyticus]|uniref:(2Fe-2S)-binding protein n=1 Tax=Deinococcus cellulosilyticus (strain DSM 18568 / NBRC 106333 / KACC 11606 / 5516J-15) TaxID=1223518 RepID=A0A511NBI7_DEIC1|nr:(2Fe-2S)-binding protein [Deinococcus cellulosilyticus NBRC 106333 = KACC 11606]